MKSFESIEEKVIYEKLSECVRETTAPLSAPKDLPLDAPAQDSNYLDIARLDQYFSEISHYIETLERTRENFADRYLHSTRKVLGKAVVFCKRVMRRLFRWYINPVMQQQSEFNSAVTPSIGRLTEIEAHLMSAVLSLSQKQEESIRALSQKQEESIRALSQKQEMQTLHMTRQLEKQADNYQELTRQKDELDIAILELVKQKDELDVTILELAKRKDEQDIAISELAKQGDEQSTTILDLLQEKERLNTTITQLMHQLKESADNNENQVRELESLLEYSNIKLNEFQGKLEQLEQLDLDIFNQDNGRFWDKKTSQSGEDAICNHIVTMLGITHKNCVYLDLGANHAKDLSNTYYFYSKGARGVLVEANPDLIPELKFYRNGDLILNKCISTKSGEFVDFHVLNGDGLSTPDLDAANEFISKNSDLRIVKTVKVETITVNEIIDQYLGKTPVLLNIDIEGKEMEILNSIDFDSYRPLLLITEMIEYQKYLVVGKMNEAIVKFMLSKDYIEYAFTGINSIFVDKRQLGERK